MPVTYFPQVFEAGDMAQARQIILTPEGSTTDERWNSKTPCVVELIGKTIGVRPASVVVDYGCGIGRISKELIQQHGCGVVGVDMSERMRALATTYVQSGNFLACSREMFDSLVEHGFKADAAIAIWVLQHCFAPSEDLDRIKGALKPGGRLFVLNNIHRAVPTKEAGFVSDGIDIQKLLSESFALEQNGVLPAELTAPGLQGLIFWASLRKLD